MNTESVATSKIYKLSNPVCDVARRPMPIVKDGSTFQRSSI